MSLLITCRYVLVVRLMSVNKPVHAMLPYGFWSTTWKCSLQLNWSNVSSPLIGHLKLMWRFIVLSNTGSLHLSAMISPFEEEEGHEVVNTEICTFNLSWYEAKRLINSMYFNGDRDNALSPSLIYDIKEKNPVILLYSWQKLYHCQWDGSRIYYLTNLCSILYSDMM